MAYQLFMGYLMMKFYYSLFDYNRNYIYFTVVLLIFNGISTPHESFNAENWLIPVWL